MVSISNRINSIFSEETDTLKSDWYLARKLGYNDRNNYKFLDENGDVKTNANAIVKLQFGCDVKPSELNLTAREACSAFDPRLQTNRSSVSSKYGFDMEVANPEKYYSDGTIKVNGHFLGSGADISNRRFHTVVDKEYAWLTGLYAIKGNKGFDFDYTATYQMDGLNVERPLLDNTELNEAPDQIIKELVSSRMKSYDISEDGKVRADKITYTVEDETICYTLTGSDSSYLIPSAIDDICKSGLIYPTEEVLQRVREDLWKAHLSFKL